MSDRGRLRSALAVDYPGLAKTAGCAYYTFKGLWGNDAAAYVGRTAGRCGAMILTLLLGCKANCVHPLAELCAPSPEECLPLPPPEDLPDDVVVEGCDGYLRTTIVGKDSVVYRLYDASSRQLLGLRGWGADTPPSCGWEVWGETIDCDPVWISGGTGGVAATGGTGAGVIPADRDRLRPRRVALSASSAPAA